MLQQCDVSKPFVVTDRNLEALTRSVLDSNDINGEVDADEVDEPTSDRVNAMAAALSSSNADGVVAIGGGSPLDAAKLAVVLSAILDAMAAAPYDGCTGRADAMTLERCPQAGCDPPLATAVEHGATSASGRMERPRRRRSNH